MFWIVTIIISSIVFLGAYFICRYESANKYSAAEKILLKSRIDGRGSSYTIISVLGVVSLTSLSLYEGFSWFWFGEYISVACMIVLFGYYFILRPRKYKKLRDELSKCNYRMCPECLYSLEGSVSDGQCPECGATYAINELESRWREVLRIEGDEANSS